MAWPDVGIFSALLQPHSVCRVERQKGCELYALGNVTDGTAGGFSEGVLPPKWPGETNNVVGYVG